ncbi:hypothetical protein QYF61_018272, partial [Mycteria americana]
MLIKIAARLEMKEHHAINPNRAWNRLICVMQEDVSDTIYQKEFFEEPAVLRERIRLAALAPPPYLRLNNSARLHFKMGLTHDRNSAAEQPQLPQPLPISLVLQTLHQLHCPSLHTLQPLNVSLVVRGPKLNTVFELRPHQCRVQGHDHFPSPAGHAVFDTSQDAIGFLGHLGTLLAHIQVAVNQHSQVLLCQAAFQPLFPKPVALHGVALAQVQDLALGLVKPHTIDLGNCMKPSGQKGDEGN